MIWINKNIFFSTLTLIKGGTSSDFSRSSVDTWVVNFIKSVLFEIDLADSISRF